MEQNTAILLIVLCAAAVFAGVTLAAAKFGTKKYAAAVKKIMIGLGYAQSIAAAVSPFLPAMAGTTVSKVLSLAQQAVTHVEAAYKAALATGGKADDTRTAEATSLIQSALALEGIEDTPEIDKLIGTVIPLLVLALPKTHAAAEPAPQSEAAAPNSNGTA